MSHASAGTDGRVEGDVAIVTGARTGIGRATAELLAREGATVVVTHYEENGAQEVVEQDACVSDFANYFGQPRGNALGLAHTLWQTGPLRPSHRAANAPGLYYVGADTQPGVGLPMCVLSGEQVADAIAADAA